MRSEISLKASFDRVRYAQCWEDADILLAALNINEQSRCLSIASAGDNTLAMLTKNPRQVIALDLSQAQLFCLELRVAAYRYLHYQELLELMGSRESSRREALLAKCLPHVAEEARMFWRSQQKKIALFGLGGIGKFEKYFLYFRKYILPLICSRQARTELFIRKEYEERHEFYNNKWNTWRWRLLLRLFFSRRVMAYLGRDPAFFRYVNKSLPEHIGQRVAHALQDLSPADNPYLYWIFEGRHGESLPLALRPDCFELIRNNLGRLSWRRQALEDFVSNTTTKIDAFNLSDIFEYMSQDNYVKLYRALLSVANPKARLIYWNMLVPRSSPSEFSNSIKPLANLAAELFKSDKAFFYSKLVVEEVK